AALEPGSADDAGVADSAESLVESVRRIRAITDQVMDARVRIDQVLASARELQVTVSEHNAI
ncbi:hypothetical protein H4S01_002086, partial [Coemansia sp. RSA 2610]